MRARRRNAKVQGRGPQLAAPLHGRDERGHLAALEAAFVAMLLFSSIAIYSGVQNHLSTENPSRAVLEQLVQDLVHSLAQLPGGNGPFNSMMEKSIALSLVDNFTTYQRLLTRSFPPLTECRLWLDNGHDRRLLAGPSERFGRESVAAAALWRPTWAYAFALPTFDDITSTQPLELEGFAVSQGSLVKEHGVPVQVTVTTNQSTYLASAVTAVRNNVAAASLYLVDNNGKANVQSTDASAFTTYTTVYNAPTANGLLAGLPTTFTVPAGVTTLQVNGNFTGLASTYVLNLTGPNSLGVPTTTLVPVVLSPLQTTGVVALPGSGVWNLSATGTITAGPLNNPAVTSILTIKAATTSVNADWTVVLQKEGAKDLPAGTNVTFHVPSRFTGLELTNTSQSGWKGFGWTYGTGSGYSGSAANDGTMVWAELASDLTSGSRNVTFHAVRPVNGDALYGAQAVLSNGTLGHADFVLGLPTGVTATDNPLSHGAYVTLPKPLSAGGLADLGVAFAYPASLTGVPESVTSVDFVSRDAVPLFNNVTGLVPSTGWSVVSPDHLRWNGSVVLTANTVAGFTARVGVVTNTSEDEPQQSVPLSFSGLGSRFALNDWVRPYVFAGSIPADPTYGYDVPTMAGLIPQGQANATINWMARGLPVRGTMPYNVTTFATLGAVEEALRTGLARSHLNLSKSRVTIGEPVDLQVDFKGLYDQFTSKVAYLSGWNVDVVILDPTQPYESRSDWKPAFRGNWGSSVGTNFSAQSFVTHGSDEWTPLSVDGTPVVSWNRTSDTLPGGAMSFNPPPGMGNPAMYAAMAANGQPIPLSNPPQVNMTFAPPRSSLFGPHTILIQANFAVKDPVSGNQIYQSARHMGVIDVVPDSGQSETALYWVSLECWLPDWQ